MKIISILIIALIVFIVGEQPGTSEFFAEPIVGTESVEKVSIVSTPVIEAPTEPLTTSPAIAITSAEVPLALPTPVTVPTSNEDVVWNGLIAAGYSREQSAGIMGNLQQEHHFQTSGDGLAQWIGNRKANLEARDNFADINVQLQFMLDELHSGYSAVNNTILASGLEGATLAFQNGYEKCGLCMESNRIQYAYDILARH